MGPVHSAVALAVPIGCYGTEFCNLVLKKFSFGVKHSNNSIIIPIKHLEVEKC